LVQCANGRGRGLSDSNFNNIAEWILSLSPDQRLDKGAAFNQIPA
jgi:hypothetical protein